MSSQLLSSISKRFFRTLRGRRDRRIGKAFTFTGPDSLERRQLLTAVPTLASSPQAVLAPPAEVLFVKPLASFSGVAASPVTAAPQANLASGFEYTENATGWTIIEYKGPSTDITVPQWISGIRVTEIGANAFNGRTDITRVVLPEGVTTIGDYAFFNNLSLKSVGLPQGLKTVGYASFGNCRSLQNVDLPSTVGRLGDFAFTNCLSLSKINLPEGMTSVGWGVFRGCSELRNVALPSTVTSIAGQAFMGCSSLKTVIIPAAVTSIGADVFTDCTSLRSVHFLGNAPSYGAHPFQNVTGATAFYMPGTTDWQSQYAGIPTKPFVGQNANFTYTITNTGVTILKYKGIATSVTVPQLIDGIQVNEIGVGAFQGRGDVVRVTLPQGLLKIGNNAFDGCGNLTSVNIPNGVTSIGDTAFIWCGRLKTLSIPASVNSIGIFWSFWGCGNLTAINVDPANTKYASQDGILYNKEMTWLYWCPAGKSGAITLAPTVQTIGYHSFQDCNRITSVTIPASVKLIEDGVFNGCTKLRSFYFQGNAPTVRAAFGPSVKATAYYVRGTTGWGTTLSGIPTATTPLAPTNLKWNAQTKTLSWNAPVSDGGSPILGYRVRYSNDGGRTWIALQTDDRTSIRLQAPAGMNQSAFSVAAVNAAGLGLDNYLVRIFPKPLP